MRIGKGRRVARSRGWLDKQLQNGYWTVVLSEEGEENGDGARERC
jgi:hypothetical protein